MMTMEEALEQLGDKPGRVTLELYIARAWVRPVKKQQSWRFEAIDIERARLVHHLEQEMRMEEHALDMLLGLLDQVYGMREQMRCLRHAIGQQPAQVQGEIRALLKEADEAFTDA